MKDTEAKQISAMILCAIMRNAFARNMLIPSVCEVTGLTREEITDAFNELAPRY